MVRQIGQKISSRSKRETAARKIIAIMALTGALYIPAMIIDKSGITATEELISISAFLGRAHSLLMLT